MFDRFMANLNLSKGRVDSSFESAVMHFNQKYGRQFKTSMENIGGDVPYTIVASTFASKISDPALMFSSRKYARNFATSGRYDNEKYHR